MVDILSSLSFYLVVDQIKPDDNLSTRDLTVNTIFFFFYIQENDYKTSLLPYEMVIIDNESSISQGANARYTLRKNKS